jgi:hypothetical protein
LRPRMNITSTTAACATFCGAELKRVS